MKEIFMKLFENWAITVVNDSNESLTENEQLRLKKESPVKFELEDIPIESKNSFDARAILVGTVLLCRSFLGKEVGEPYSVNKVLIDKTPATYTNPGDKEVKAECKLSFTQEQVNEWERTKGWTQGLSIGLGASAYGVDANVGYEANWSVSTREGSSLHTGSATDIAIPVSIPPNTKNAHYTFSKYRSELMQNYQLDLLVLRGKVFIRFENHHQVKFEAGKFIKSKDLHIPGVSNKVEVSIVEILKRLQQGIDLQKLFIEPFNWKFDNAKDEVSYQGKVSLFRFFMKEVVTDAHVILSNAISVNTFSKTDKKSDISLPEQGLPFFNFTKEHFGTKMPDELAKSDVFASTVKEKIKSGLSANPNLNLLLEKLTTPNLTDKVGEFLMQQIDKLNQGIADPDVKNYLQWVEKNRGQIATLPGANIIDRTVDLYINAKSEQRLTSYAAVEELKKPETDKEKTKTNQLNF